ncbi:MAG: GldG family protein [Anaerolineaceae bacterium]|nr:GldG family protein [Anaerolineaceae bacterium]
MKKLQKYAFIPLIVGLVAAVAALILRITSGQFTIPVRISIILAVVGLVLSIVFDPGSILTFFQRRQTKHGGNAFVLTLAVIGILVIVNLFIYNNNVSWDLTADKENSLTKETLDVLNNLDLTVNAKAFYSSDTSTAAAETLFENFRRNAAGKFDYEFIDPYNDPVAANQANISVNATTVLSADDQTQMITSLTEENLINAIVKLQNPEQSAVYVLTGHGEEDFFTSSDYSLVELENLMEAKNYQVSTLNLVSSPSIPEDAKAIFIAAPQIPLSQDEVDLLSGFMANGGSLILLSEPEFLTEGAGEDDALKTYLQDNWGLTMGNDLVIDPSINPMNYAVADQYGVHPITDAVNNYTTFFPTAHSLAVEAVTDVTFDELVLTTAQSWGETNIEGLYNNEAEQDEADLSGPVTIAVALENTSTSARVVVVGDSDFATDTFITAYGNLDFAIAMVDWATANENLINLSVGETTTRVLVPPTNATKLGIILGGLVGIPLIIAAAGIAIAIQRKRTG